ncbi:BLUF domain-containing protein [Phenylobacterium sp. J426]|uniref:BLUF domain-containing protein n=1 Tax=Phenylobacterium sp. J426 TaxID=2898439 RepID=UPI002150ED67|nr:BLUF domain-containing protein [Phenylobacterium sp. J426]MCR5874093.1 BLUF domain-containing protein [Phenylobacterium sp. J426]
MSANSAISGSRTLHRLVYASRQAIEPVRLNAQVDEIIRASIRNNRAVAITGLLLVHDGWFLQALEGPAEAVMSTYRRILDDPRHKEPRVLQAGPATMREFANWNMCARRMSDADDAILKTLSQREIDFAVLGGDQALKLLKVVRGIQSRTELARTA